MTDTARSKRSMVLGAGSAWQGSAKIGRAAGCAIGSDYQDGASRNTRGRLVLAEVAHG